MAQSVLETNAPPVDEPAVVRADTESPPRSTSGHLPDGGGSFSRSAMVEDATSAVRAARLGVVGVFMLLVAGWAVIIPFIGPAFGFSADGSGSWHWSLMHALLWFVPGVVACTVAGIIVALSPFAAMNRAAPGVACAGAMAALCGAWFVVGFLAWPIMYSVHPVFVGAAPLRELAFQVGYSLGPGSLLLVLGGVAMGWGMRRQAPVRQ